jgi:hypothetical protein
MPEGFGYVHDGKPDPAAGGLLDALPTPGRDATQEAEVAARAVQRLATAAGHRLVVPAGGSATRDRITIAAAVVLGVAFAGGLLLYRRQSRTLRP